MAPWNLHGYVRKDEMLLVALDWVSVANSLVFPFSDWDIPSISG